MGWFSISLLIRSSISVLSLAMATGFHPAFHWLELMPCSLPFAGVFASECPAGAFMGKMGSRKTQRPPTGGANALLVCRVSWTTRSKAGKFPSRQPFILQWTWVRNELECRCCWPT